MSSLARTTAAEQNSAMLSRKNLLQYRYPIADSGRVKHKQQELPGLLITVHYIVVASAGSSARNVRGYTSPKLYVPIADHEIITLWGFHTLDAIMLPLEYIEA